VIGAEVGKYTFEFKFGTISRTITVNVVKNIQAELSNVKFGASSAPLFNGNFLIKDSSTVVDGNVTGTVVNGNVTATVNSVGLNSDMFYRVTSSLVGTGPEDDFAWVDADNAELTLPNVGAFTAIPETFTSIVLGRLQDKVSLDAAANVRAVLTIEFFEKVEIGVNLLTGDKVYTYNKVGETQVLNFRLLAA
jgi:hypothetical protein